MMDYWDFFVIRSQQPLEYQYVEEHLWFWFLFANGLQLLQLFHSWKMPEETGKQWQARCRKFDDEDSWWRP